MQSDRANVSALKLLAIAERVQGNTGRARSVLDSLPVVDPLSHFARFERYLLDPSRELVFPYRTETMRVLEWADMWSSNWKTSYYLGLWANQQPEQTWDLWASLDDAPDFAPFYLTRGLLAERQSLRPGRFRSERYPAGRVPPGSRLGRTVAAGRKTADPAVKLANNMQTDDGWYRIGDITVSR